MTKSTYEVIEATEFSSGFIRKTDENGQVWAIPIDPSNSDYQAYLNKDNPVQPIGGNK